MKNNRAKVKYRGTYCLNCEHPLDRSDAYCPGCGQLNSTKKPAFDDFFQEFLSGIFAYDSRIRRTLSTLLFSPGKISRDYIAGKRMRYANPFKFYLSTSIIFFILWSFFSNINEFNTGIEQNRNTSQQLSPGEIEKLRTDLQKVPGIENSRINIDSLLITRRVETPVNYRQYYISQDKLDSLGFFSSLSPQLTLYYNFHDQTDIAYPPRALDSLQHTNSSYNRWAYKKVVDFKTVLNEPKIFYNYFISKLPFIIFFYLPFFALFIWLLYARKNFNYMEHLIFTFHVQSTFFVFLGISLILDAIFKTGFFTGFINLVFLFYLYKAMRRFYAQGRFKTLVKFVILNGIFLTLAVIAAIFSLIASFAIY